MTLCCLLDTVTYLFWARLILHSCHTRSTTCVACRRGIFPPWWLVLSTLNTSDDEGILTHFLAEWESTREGEDKVNGRLEKKNYQFNGRDNFKSNPWQSVSILQWYKSTQCESLPVCVSSGDVGGVRVTKEMAGSRWEAGTWWPPE